MLEFPTQIIGLSLEDPIYTQSLSQNLLHLEDRLNVAAAYQRQALRLLQQPDLSWFSKIRYELMIEWANDWMDRCHAETVSCCWIYGYRLRVRHNHEIRTWRLEVAA